MSFSYQPMSEDEVQKAREFSLLPDGIYDFEIVESKFSYSHSSNPMIGLKLTINHEGQEYGVFDNLVAAKSMLWKTKHFCDSTGLQREYAAGQFNETHCPRRRGVCQIGTVPARPKNDGSGGMWKAKNEVVDYLEGKNIAPAHQNHFMAAPKPLATQKAPSAPEEFISEDIPF